MTFDEKTFTPNQKVLQSQGRGTQSISFHASSVKESVPKRAKRLGLLLHLVFKGSSKRSFTMNKRVTQRETLVFILP